MSTLYFKILVFLKDKIKIKISSGAISLGRVEILSAPHGYITCGNFDRRKFLVVLG